MRSVILTMTSFAFCHNNSSDGFIKTCTHFVLFSENGNRIIGSQLFIIPSTVFPRYSLLKFCWLFIFQFRSQEHLYSLFFNGNHNILHSKCSNAMYFFFNSLFKPLFIIPLTPLKLEEPFVVSNCEQLTHFQYHQHNNK